MAFNRSTLEAAHLSLFPKSWAISSPPQRLVLTLNQKPPSSVTGAVTAGWDQLEVEVTDPVDYVEEQEGGGEKNPGVGIQLADVDVDPSFLPAAFFTLLVAAEEARAVFAIQALVQAVVFIVVPEQGVAHGHHGTWGVSHVER